MNVFLLNMELGPKTFKLIRNIDSTLKALETYQCPNWPTNQSDCPTNDHPTVAALHVLTERALELPSATKEQKKQWGALRAALPPVPMIVEDNNVTVVSPYSTYPDAYHRQDQQTRDDTKPVSVMIN